MDDLTDTDADRLRKLSQQPGSLAERIRLLNDIVVRAEHHSSYHHPHYRHVPGRFCGLVVAALRNANIACGRPDWRSGAGAGYFGVCRLSAAHCRRHYIRSNAGAGGFLSGALAIAFGFGARDWAADIVNQAYVIRKPG